MAPAQAQHPGDILWRTPLEVDETELMNRPEIGPGGAIHMLVNDLFVVNPDGTIRREIPVGTTYTSDVAVTPDGNIFVGAAIFRPGVGIDYYVIGYAPTGEELWRTPIEATEAMSYGPTLGPDGNLYGVIGFGDSGAGAFSVATDGAFRWSVPGFERESNLWPKEVPFASDRFYAADESVPCQLFSNGIAAFSFDGDMLWCIPWNVEHPPVVGPDDSVYGLGYNSLTKFSPDGDLLWRFNFPSPVGLLRDPAIGPDGTVYVIERRSLWAFNPDGSVRYEVEITDSGSPLQPTVSPSGDLILVHVADFGNQQLLALDAADASERWRVSLPEVTDPPYTFTPGGDTVYVPLKAAYEEPLELMAIYVGESAPMSVNAEPTVSPVVIPASGGSFEYTVTLTNTTGEPQAFQAWSEATGPINRSPVLVPRTVTLPPGATVTRVLTQVVPGAAPAGSYTYAVHIGTYGGVVMSSGSFPVEKEGVGVGQSRSEYTGEGAAWSVRGWEDEVEAAGQASRLAEGFALSAVYPNPFNGRARFTLDVAEAQRVTVAVFDALGRRVAVPHDGLVEGGTTRSFALDAGRLPGGVYLLQVSGETFNATRSVTLLP